MPLLYANADDFGLHPDIDRAIADGVGRGRITGVSVCANGGAIDWTHVRALVSQADVGVHVTLVGEPWLTSARLFEKWPRLVPWLALPGRRAMLEREIRAQVEHFLKRDIRPTHLDSHQHCHILPTIWPLFERLAKEYGIPHVRVPAAPRRAIAKQSLAGQVLQRLSERRATPATLPCIGVAHAGHNDVTILSTELAAAAGRDVELVAHPAYETAALRERYGDWQFDWSRETDALYGDAWGEAVERAGYWFGRRAV